MWFYILIHIINAYPWDTVPLRLQKVKTTEAHLRVTIFLLISKHLMGKEVSKILQQLVTASDTHIRIDTANCLVLWTNWNIILENLLLLSSIISIVPILIHTSVSTKMDRSTHFRKGLMMCTYTYVYTHTHTCIHIFAHIWTFYLNMTNIAIITQFLRNKIRQPQLHYPPPSPSLWRAVACWAAQRGPVRSRGSATARGCGRPSKPDRGCGASGKPW